jgi:hypothetical protein
MKLPTTINDPTRFFSHQSENPLPLSHIGFPLTFGRKIIEEAADLVNNVKAIAEALRSRTRSTLLEGGKNAQKFRYVPLKILDVVNLGARWCVSEDRLDIKPGEILVDHEHKANVIDHLVQAFVDIIS